MSLFYRNLLCFIFAVCIALPIFAQDEGEPTVSADVEPAEENVAVASDILTLMNVVESIGVTELRQNGMRTPVGKGNLISQGATLWTGLHASISCSIAGYSVITANQLAKLTFMGGVQTPKGIEYTLSSDSGFIIINSRPLGEQAVIIKMITSVGTFICRNFVGQIYIGSDHGILVTVNEGTVKVQPKIKTFYTVRKGGMCAVTKDGYLIDNDKLIQGKLAAVPSNITDAESVSMFINRFSQPYTKERYTNDFFDNNHR